MTASYTQATDEMFAVVLANWNAATTVIVGSEIDLRWPGVEEDKPGREHYWGRVSRQTVIENQTSLSADIALVEGGSLPASRHTASGLLFIQIFCPKSVAGSYNKGSLIAEAMKNGFKGKKTEGGVWFMNARVNELTDEELWHRFNVVTEWEYDEVA